MHPKLPWIQIWSLARNSFRLIKGHLLGFIGNGFKIRIWMRYAWLRTIAYRVFRRPQMTFRRLWCPNSSRPKTSPSRLRDHRINTLRENTRDRIQRLTSFQTGAAPRGLDSKTTTTLKSPKSTHHFQKSHFTTKVGRHKARPKLLWKSKNRPKAKKAFWTRPKIPMCRKTACTRCSASIRSSFRLISTPFGPKSMKTTIICSTERNVRNFSER